MNTFPDKLETVKWFFSQGHAAFLYLDSSHPDVRVPDRFKNQVLVLEVGFNMPLPIKDLFVDEAGFSGVLSFDREPHFCYVPWDVVHMIMGDDGTGVVWKKAPILTKHAPKKGLTLVKGGVA